MSLYSPFISVIVASYNYEKYIRECLNSIVEQTYDNYEVIIIDDGSKDNSVDIINEFVQKYDNFKLYTHPNNENKGLIATLKYGLELSQGEYIAFCESDDYWDKEYLAEKSKFISTNREKAVIVSGISTVGDKKLDNIVEFMEHFWRKHSNDKNLSKYFLESNYLLTFSSAIIKKSVLQECDFNSYVDAWLDYWLYAQISINNSFGFVDRKLTYWRIHKNSYISRNSKEKNIKKEWQKLKAALLRLLYSKYKFKFIKCLVIALFYELLLRFFSIKLLHGKNLKRLKIRFLGVKMNFSFGDNDA